MTTSERRTTIPYERGWRMGAIRVRREVSADLRCAAAKAHAAGKIDEALSLHSRADDHDAISDRYISEMNSFCAVLM
jgi:hypothetical protein